MEPQKLRERNPSASEDLKCYRRADSDGSLNERIRDICLSTSPQVSEAKSSEGTIDNLAFVKSSTTTVVAAGSSVEEVSAAPSGGSGSLNKGTRSFSTMPIVQELSPENGDNLELQMEDVIGEVPTTPRV